VRTVGDQSTLNICRKWSYLSAGCRVPQVSIMRTGIMAAPFFTLRTQASICRPCFWTMVRSLTAMPLGFFTPLSHFSTVDSLVFRRGWSVWK
jgi:hypothetical protein